MEDNIFSRIKLQNKEKLVKIIILLFLLLVIALHKMGVSFSFSSPLFADNPFSKYEKKSKNDLEKSGIKGSVKEIKIYSYGKLSKLVKYNIYGFKTEETSYHNGVVDISYIFIYDKYGCLVKEKSQFCGRKVEITYTYDEYHNLTSITEGHKEKEMHEYEYDKEGNILVERLKDESSTTVNKYNPKGELVEKKILVDKGSVLYTWRYEFYADGKPYRTSIYNDDGTLFQYTETIYEGENISTETSYQPDCDPLTKKYKYDEHNNVISIEEYHTITNFEYDENGHVISELENSNGRITSKKYRYDSKGNIIFEHIDMQGRFEEIRTFEIIYYEK